MFHSEHQAATYASQSSIPRNIHYHNTTNTNTASCKQPAPKINLLVNTSLRLRRRLATSCWRTWASLDEHEPQRAASPATSCWQSGAHTAAQHPPSRPKTLTRHKHQRRHRPTGGSKDDEPSGVVKPKIFRSTEQILTAQDTQCATGLLQGSCDTHFVTGYTTEETQFESLGGGVI